MKNELHFIVEAHLLLYTVFVHLICHFWGSFAVFIEAISIARRPVQIVSKSLY